jgi:hypothetical protein
MNGTSTPYEYVGRGGARGSSSHRSRRERTSINSLLRVADGWRDRPVWLVGSSPLGVIVARGNQRRLQDTVTALNRADMPGWDAARRTVPASS